MKQLIVIAALLAACRTPAPPAPKQQEPQAVPASALQDVAGETVETAVPVPVEAPNGGVDFENDWIFSRYGRFKRDAGGTGTAAGRRYDVVKIELPSGDKKTVYFDITENWARWKP